MCFDKVGSLGQDGFMLESSVNRMIARKLFEMAKSSTEMDMYGGTDYVVLCDDNNVAVGLTMNGDVNKWNRDAEKFAGFAYKNNLLCKYAAMHIQIVVCEDDCLYWDAALVKALTKADEIACNWEPSYELKQMCKNYSPAQNSEIRESNWDTWKSAYQQVIIKASRKGVTVSTKTYFK